MTMANWTLDLGPLLSKKILHKSLFAKMMRKTASSRTLAPALFTPSRKLKGRQLYRLKSNFASWVYFSYNLLVVSYFVFLFIKV